MAPVLVRFFAFEPRGEALEKFSLDGLGAECVASFHGARSEKILDRAVVELAHEVGREGSEPVRRRQAWR